MTYRAIFAWLFLVMSIAPAVSAQGTTAERFGTIAETWDAEISPDGKNLALGCSPQGVPAVCIYALDSDAKPKMLPPPGRARITDLYWASDRFLLYSVNMFDVEKTSSGLTDKRINRLISYDLQTGKSAILMRNAGAVDDTTNIESILTNKSQKVLMAFSFYFGESISTGTRLGSKEGETTFIVYEVDLKSGKAKVKDTTQRSIGGAVFDQNGKRHANLFRDYKKDYFAVESLRDGKKIVLEDKDAEIAPLYVEGLSDDRSQLIVDFDDGARDGLFTLSLSDGAIAQYTVDGRSLGDVGLLKDRHRATIVGYYHTDDTTRAEYSDPELKRIQQQVRNALKVENVWLNSWSADRSQFVVSATKQARPSQYYLFDPVTPSLSPVGGEAPWLDEAVLGAVSKLTYAARDGKQIPAYLTLPPSKAKTDGPFPLMLMPHGGPEARDTAEYDWLAQAVAAEGYAVLQPNFRGSSGYGAEFRNAGFGEFGDKMVTDVLDGAAHLVSQGVAKSGGHCTMGWSYGGYSSLMAGLHDQANTKCIISINGVTDPFALANDGPAALAYWERYMGDFYSTRRSEKKSITPLKRASEYSAPILLIHGKEDTTVPYGQSSTLAKRLGGADAKLITMKGDDHGMYNTASRRKVIEESLAFLAEHHPAE